MKFDLTWSESHDQHHVVVEAGTSDEAIRKLARQLGDPAELTCEVEPEDDLGYAWRRKLPAGLAA